MIAGKMGVMPVRWVTAYIDTPRGAMALRAEEFWRAATNTTMSVRRGDHEEFATLVPPDGDAFLKAQRTESGDPSCHLDFHLDDAPAGLARALELGASLVARNTDFDVLHSPGGLPFCVMRHLGQSVRPAPIRWPAGQRSLVDQVCVDIPPARHESETQFWSDFTGWQLRPGALPEFEYLERPHAMPISILLQRLDDASDAQVRAHIDFACDDVEQEVARHISLGAQVVRRRSWVTLLDPVGRVYCVTGRKP